MQQRHTCKLWSLAPDQFEVNYESSGRNPLPSSFHLLPSIFIFIFSDTSCKRPVTFGWCWCWAAIRANNISLEYNSQVKWSLQSCARRIYLVPSESAKSRRGELSLFAFQKKAPPLIYNKHSSFTNFVHKLYSLFNYYSLSIYPWKKKKASVTHGVSWHFSGQQIWGFMRF